MKGLPAVETGISYLSVAEGAAAEAVAGTAVVIAVVCAVVISTAADVVEAGGAVRAVAVGRSADVVACRPSFGRRSDEGHRATEQSDGGSSGDDCLVEFGHLIRVCCEALAP